MVSKYSDQKINDYTDFTNMDEKHISYISIFSSNSLVNDSTSKKRVKFYKKEEIKDKSGLKGVQSDRISLTKIRAELEKKNKKTKQYQEITLFNDDDHGSKDNDTYEEVINSIEKIFNNDVDGVFMLLSGHGNNQGNFILETKYRNTYLDFNIVKEKWKSRKFKDRNKTLLIIVDSCFSGVWVNLNEKAKVENLGIHVQSACRSYEVAKEIDNKGGLLIYSLFTTNFDYSKIEDVKNQVDSMSDLQIPCFSGCFRDIMLTFGMYVGFNSWDNVKSFKTNIFRTVLESGNIYEGEYNKYNQRHGMGIFYFNNEIGKLDIYIGEYKEDKKHGRGIFFHNNGDRYEGEWKEGKKLGKGICFYKNKDRYEGEWKEDKKHGKGIFFYNNGDRYEGKYEEGKCHGKGACFYNNGNRYEGEWKEGKYHGKGVGIYKNEFIYEGEWKEGKYHGKGIYIYKNGDRYEGEWKEDKKHGKFIIFYENGTKEYLSYIDGEKFEQHECKSLKYIIKKIKSSYFELLSHVFTIRNNDDKIFGICSHVEQDRPKYFKNSYEYPY